MLAIELLLKEKKGDQSPEVCAVTGRTTTDYVPFDDVFSDNFGSYDLLVSRNSKFVDFQISQILSDGHLRWSSWVCTSDGLQICKKYHIRKVVMEPMVYPFGAYAALDMRRQGGLLAVANHSEKSAVISIGLRKAHLLKTREIYQKMEKVQQNLGIGRNDFSSLVPFTNKWVPEQYREWLEWKKYAEPLLYSAEYELAVWLLPTKEESEGKLVVDEGKPLEIKKEKKVKHEQRHIQDNLSFDF